MTMKTQKRRGLKPLARMAAMGAASLALVGGVTTMGAAPVSADSSPNNDHWAKLPMNPDTPDRMKLSVNRPTAVVQPGDRATVRVDWDSWNIWSLFQTDKQGQGNVKLAQDLIKVWANETATLTLNGQKCTDFGRYEGGGKPVEGWEQGVGGEGNTWIPADIGGIGRQIVAALHDIIAGVPVAEAIAPLIDTNLRATCEFTVPEKSSGNINVGGNVVLSNLFGLIREENEGVGYLKVAAPEAPGKPTILGGQGNRINVTEGGVLKGEADPGSVIRLKVDGEIQPDPSTTANQQGFWELKLPERLKAGNEYLVEAVAQNKNGGEKVESETKRVTVTSSNEEAESDETVEFYQSLVPSAKPGEGSFLDITFEPTNGDVTALAGKKLELTAPEGFTFNDQVSFKVFGKEGDGEGIWLGDRVQISDGGTKATVTLPSAAEIKKTFNASIVAVKFKITTFPKATSGATPGPKTGGQATIDGIGSTKLTGNVTGR